MDKQEILELIFCIVLLTGIILLCGVFVSASHICYQEFTNQTSSCGGNSGGNYSLNGFWLVSTKTKLYDGIWSTGSTSINGGTAQLNSTYVLPNGLIYTGNLLTMGLESAPATSRPMNITIDSTCLSSPLQPNSLKIFVESLFRAVSYYGCYNSTNKIYLYNYTNGSISGTLKSNVDDEGVHWNLTYPNMTVSQNMSKFNFLPKSRNDKCLALNGQTINNSAFASYNNYTYTIPLYAKINMTLNNLTILCSQNYNCTGSIPLITNYTQIATANNLSWAKIYCWANYSNPRTTQKFQINWTTEV